MRLAWFSPMPPVRSGVAACSAELVALLDEHEIDVFVDLVESPSSPAPQLTGSHASKDPQLTSSPAHQLPRFTRLPSSPAHPLPGSPASKASVPRVSVSSAHDFVWLHRQRPYDLTVYQLGNSSHHDFIWPYVFRYPGLAVLHDVHLHHARAALLLRERRADDYRAEFSANEPDANADAAELAIAGFDSFIHYQWPFTRLVCAASRLTAVHSRAARDELQASVPEARIEYVRLGHGTLVPATDSVERGAAARRRFGIAPDAILFGCFGGLTPDKRIAQILDAFAAVPAYAPSARLMLAGSEAEHFDVRSEIDRRELGSRVVVTGYLETESLLTDCISACDVTLNLRWPTAREISGPWLRCLAAGRASIVIDLSHTTDVPSLDPRTWTTGLGNDSAAVTAAVDIMDEDHSLRLAMRRLAMDRPLRERLGTAARDFWIREHSQEAMAADYRRLLATAAETPVPVTRLPAHAIDDESRVAAGILGQFGMSLPWSKI